MERGFGWLIALGLFVSSVSLTVSPLFSQTEDAAAPPAGDTVDLHDLEAFLDGVMAADLQAHHVAGAVVSVVKDGRVAFAKGYGYSDVEARKRVDPERTLFRVGSVSKLFTWTAVMQLAGAGKLKLEGDVNQYLADFKIPPTFPEPITLASLMTHTPGFEDQVIGLFARDPAKLRPLGEILARELPARVRPPFKLSSYSNHGTGLAGYIVEQVSGTDFDSYVEANILKPLGMRRTTFRQPLPPDMAPDMSKGYKWVDGRFKEQDFELVPLAPAGAASASATDMARFMIAHLQLGLGPAGGRILSEESAREMQSRLFVHDPRLPGWLHGFYEIAGNGQRVFGHGGDTLYFHTQLALFPEQRLGLFVSYNSQSGPAARGELMRAFLDRYFPSPETLRGPTADDFAERVQRLEGTYRALRYSHTSLAKLAALSPVRVKAEDGLLRIEGLGSDPTRWFEVEPLVFQRQYGPGRIVFKENDQGRITHLFISAFPVAFAKLSAWETPQLHLSLFGACLALFASALFFWPFGAWSRRRRGEIRHPKAARFATLVGWIVCVLFVLFVGGLAIALQDPTEIVFQIPRVLSASLWLPLMAAVIAPLFLLFVIFAWKNSYWGMVKRLHYTVVLLASLVFLVLLNYWNLLGFRY